MTENLTPELYWTAATALFTGLMWVPIIINRIMEMGLWVALKNPQPDVRPESDWAYRLANGHRNGIENLVVFAPLALGVHVLGAGTTFTAAAAMLFFFSRIAHAAIYTAGVPLLRTIAFAIGFACQVIMAGRLFGWL